MKTSNSNNTNKPVKPIKPINQIKPYKHCSVYGCNPMSSEPFVSNIQQWMVLEKQIKSINERAKQLRDQRHALSTQICQHIQSNQLQKTKIEISNSGELKMIEKRDYSSFTFTYAETQLRDLVTAGVISQTQMEQIMNAFRANREVTVHSEIVLYPTKPM